MARFYPLRVAEIRRDTRDAVVLTLEPRPEDTDAFRFVQGQYLTFRREFDGEELRRSYSICAGRGEGRLRVGIKKVEGGWFSAWANEELAPGDTIEAMAPMGNFHAPLEAEGARHYLLFAGGSGITPILSIVKTVLAEEPRATLTLVYGNRSTSAIMFREELEDLKDQHLGRLSIIHVLESEAQDIDLFNGRLDRQKCDLLFSRWIDPKRADLAFICGPEPMMKAVSEALEAHGMDKAKIKFELFASSRPKKPRPRPEGERASDGIVATARIVLDGVSREITLRDGESVLEAARAATIDAPFSCCAGVCSTCRAKLVEGEVEMEANYALEDYEVERGYILTCQSRPVTKRLVVDYDG